MAEIRKTLPKRVERVQVIQVIDVVSVEGAGTETDPLKIVHSYWSLDGTHLATEEEVSE